MVQNRLANTIGKISNFFHVRRRAIIISVCSPKVIAIASRLRDNGQQQCRTRPVNSGRFLVERARGNGTRRENPHGSVGFIVNSSFREPPSFSTSRFRTTDNYRIVISLRALYTRKLTRPLSVPPRRGYY